MNSIVKTAMLFFLPALMGFHLPAYADESPPTVSSAVEAWLNSPHADYSSEAFRHWDEDGEIPTSCAACHSSSGFMDYIGADGSEAGKVDNPAVPLSVVECATCHTPAAEALDSVTFPSGIMISNLGSSASCTVCHQGRQSTPSVNAAVTGLDADTPSADLGFINVHYRVAAAMLYGTEVKGAYEYEGKEYSGKFAHVLGLDSCSGCHDPHSLEVAPDNCVSCHKVDALGDIRTSPSDYDGDGDTAEGISGEIASLHQTLGSAMYAYASEVTGAPIVYAAGAYPYFFNDTNGNGVGEPGETIYPNRYASWTPRLLKAAYNYQYIAVDPGAYAHNPHYAIQILLDSIGDLAEKVTVDLPAVSRP